MLKVKILGFTILGVGLCSTGYYKYQHDNSIRSVCNLIYAGTNMAYIYKFSKDPI